MTRLPRYRFDIAQGTPEWDAVRAGKWTASNAAIVMGGLSTSGLINLVKDVAWERVFGTANELRYASRAMDRGHEVEPEAREAFAFERDVQVVECGFVVHAELPHVGWSPDGLHSPHRGSVVDVAMSQAGITASDPAPFVHYRRAIEAKAPLHRAFMEVLRTGKVPSEYRWQCKWACWVGQLDALDFLAHHPTLGSRVIEVTATQEECDTMAARVHLLEKQVAEWIDILTTAKDAA